MTSKCESCNNSQILNSVNDPQILLTKYPEIENIMNEITDSYKHSKNIISQINELLTEDFINNKHKGISYLDIKISLMLLYSKNLAQFIQLKSTGIKIDKHPVLTRLVKIKLLIEKLKPLDQRLKQQIDKMLKLALTGNPVDRINNNAESEDENHLKPRPDLLVDKHTIDDYDDENNKQKPPKLRSITQEESNDPESASKLKGLKNSNRLKRKLLRSELFEEIISEYGVAPDEYNASTGYKNYEDDNEYSNNETKQEKDRRTYEEDNFIRLPLTKKDKIREKARIKTLIEKKKDLGLNHLDKEQKTLENIMYQDEESDKKNEEDEINFKKSLEIEKLNYKTKNKISIKDDKLRQKNNKTINDDLYDDQSDQKNNKLDQSTNKFNNNSLKKARNMNFKRKHKILFNKKRKFR